MSDREKVEEFLKYIDETGACHDSDLLQLREMVRAMLELANSLQMHEHNMFSAIDRELAKTIERRLAEVLK